MQQTSILKKKLFNNHYAGNTKNKVPFVIVKQLLENKTFDRKTSTFKT